MSFLSSTNILYRCAKLQNKHNDMNPAFVPHTHILQSGLTLKRIRCRETCFEVWNNGRSPDARDARSSRA